MARAPDPEIQRRNIREAWGRLSENDRYELAIELFGPLEREVTKEVTKVQVEEVLVEVSVPIEKQFEALSWSARVEVLDRLATILARDIDWDLPVSDFAAPAADAVRALKNAMGGG